MNGEGAREADTTGLAFDRSSSHVQGTSGKILYPMGQPPEFRNTRG
jgi:hypothetical protein